MFCVAFIYFAEGFLALFLLPYERKCMRFCAIIMVQIQQMMWNDHFDSYVIHTKDTK